MFMSLSKTLKKFGGFRFGFGIRLTKSNAFIMLFVLMFVCMFQAVWYLLLIYFWLIYAVIYGIVWFIKLPFRLLRKGKKNGDS